MYNLDKLLNMINDLESAQDALSASTDARNATRNQLFTETLNEVINTYIDSKADYASFNAYIDEVCTELTISTEKPSVHAVIEIIEHTLTNQHIKHNLISYTEARNLHTLQQWVNVEALKDAVKEDDYTKALKAVIKDARANKREWLRTRNEALTAHIDSKTDIADLELLIALAQDRIKTLKKEYKA